MQLKEAIRQRRSIRRFLSKPIPREILAEIISEARWAPSWGNTQPWEIVVAIGEPLARFKKENHQGVVSGKKVTQEISMPDSWPDKLNTRYKNIGKSVLKSLSIPRDDLEGRTRYYTEMFSLFDASGLVLLTLDKSVSLEYAMLDCGLILQNILLLAHEKGLGSCVLAASIIYTDIARKLFSIPDNKQIVIGAAIGWPDIEAPVNNFKRDRADLGDIVTWIE